MPPSAVEYLDWMGAAMLGIVGTGAIRPAIDGRRTADGNSRDDLIDLPGPLDISRAVVQGDDNDLRPIVELLCPPVVDHPAPDAVFERIALGQRDLPTPNSTSTLDDRVATCSSRY